MTDYSELYTYLKDEQARLNAELAQLETKTQPGDERREGNPFGKREEEATEAFDMNSLQNIDYLRSQWKDFVSALRGEGSRGNLDAFLRSACEPVKIEDDVLTVGFYAKFHKEYIEDPKYKHLVEKKMLEFFGQPYKLNCIIIERKKETKTETISPVVKAALTRGAKIID